MMVWLSMGYHYEWEFVMVLHWFRSCSCQRVCHDHIRQTSGEIPQTTTLKIVYWKKAWSLTWFLFDKVWGFLGAKSPSWPMAAQFSDKCICKSAKESWPALLEQHYEKAPVCQKPFLPISGPRRYNKLECINNRVTNMAKIDFQYNAMKYHMVFHCA